MAEPRPNDVQEDEAYNSASDEDFNPDAQPQEAEVSSSEDELALETTSARVRKLSRKRNRNDDIIDAELASGDEVTIQEKKSKRQRKDGDDEFMSDDEGGEGGFVKTRSQRKNEQKEKKPLARIDGATIDVNSLWAQLSSLPVGRSPGPIDHKGSQDEDDYITIQRTTKFAGQVTTEERRVLKSSAEAKIYLAEQEAKKKKETEKQATELDKPESTAEVSETQPDTAVPKTILRPLFRRSRFEPNPSGEVKGLPPHLQLRWPRNKPSTAQIPTGADENAPVNRRALPALPAAAKLNTVQKSKYDWAGYVDKAGIAEELDEYGKSKQSYAGRTDFLNRIEGRREEERREARMKAG